MFVEKIKDLIYLYVGLTVPMSYSIIDVLAVR